MKVLNRAGSSQKKKKFPTIVLGSQKLRDKIKAKIVKRIKRKKEQNRLECEKCGEKFALWWDMREHWQATGHKEPEQCRWCRKKTYTLQSHLCKEHWDMACMCTYCGQLFMFKERLKDHEQCHSGTEYRCYLCGKQRKTQDLLRNHIFQHYVYERYGCNVCEKRFKKKKTMEKHLKYVHFICQYCGNTCGNKGQLVDHFKSHNDLKCVFCNKVFSAKTRLKYHYQMQHGHQDFYKCSLCFQRFPLKSRLLNHLKLRHKGFAKISCETCEMPFLFWSQYLNHFEKVHVKIEDIERFGCSFCDFSTNNKLKLKWHVEKTSGNGFFCKMCQLRLDCKTRFDEHMKIHDGKKVWSCDYCVRSYATADVLRHHMSVFHQEVIMGENPQGYPCLVPGCIRYYTAKNSLARHMRTSHMETGVSCSSGQFCAENTVVCRLPLTQEKTVSRESNEETVVSSSTWPSPEEPDSSELHSETAEMNSSKERADTSDSISTIHSLKKNHIDNDPDTTEINIYYCDICSKFWFADDKQFRKHMTTHTKQVWDDECSECEEILESPEDAVRHYVEDHLKVRYARYY